VSVLVLKLVLSAESVSVTAPPPGGLVGVGVGVSVGVAVGAGEGVAVGVGVGGGDDVEAGDGADVPVACGVPVPVGMTVPVPVGEALPVPVGGGVPGRIVPVAAILGVPVAMPVGDGRGVPVTAAVPDGEDIADGEGASVPVSGVAVSSPESVHASSDKAARRSAMNEVSNGGGRLEVITGSLAHTSRGARANVRRDVSVNAHAVAWKRNYRRGRKRADLNGER
jgi:hypothetical protein